jgi:hypothetical protein
MKWIQRSVTKRSRGKKEGETNQVSSEDLNGVNSNTALSQPLPGELYQRIHVTALKRVVRGVHTNAVPDTIDVAHLKGCLIQDGPDSLLAHPTDITRIFAGVTLDTIRTIKRLYCSRLGRSIRMVWMILNAGEQGSETHAISYEAVWAICLFFEEHRRASVDISVERGKETWWLGIVSPDFTLSGPHTPSHRPAIACLVDVQTQRMLSFRIGPADILQELIGLALYDALAAQRTSTPRPRRTALAPSATNHHRRNAPTAVFDPLPARYHRSRAGNWYATSTPGSPRDMGSRPGRAHALTKSLCSSVRYLPQHNAYIWPPSHR